jgi:hypothetical protein
MMQFRFCPVCGTEFPDRSAPSDSRIAAGYPCAGCDAVFEITANRFPRPRRPADRSRDAVA